MLEEATLSTAQLSKPDSLKADYSLAQPGRWDRASQPMSGCLCTHFGSPRTPAQSFAHTQHYSCKGHADASPKQSSDRSFIVSNGAVTPLPGINQLQAV